MPPHRIPWPDREIAAIAERQAAAITHAQLRALGIPPRSIAAAVRRGRLHAVHVGVFSLVPEAARPRRAAEHAALLAVGPGVLLSHAFAVPLYGFTVARPQPGALVEVTIVGTDRGRRRPGLTVHRTASLPRDDRARVAGLPVTSIARTVIDLAPRLSDDLLEQLVDEALRRISRVKLREAAERRAGRPGAARVLGLLDPGRPSAEAWSRSERRLRRALIGAGLPAPEANQSVGPYVVDLMWREHRVIVEYDSELHDGSRATRRDAARHNDLESWGWSVLHVTWPQLRDHLDRVLVWVAVQLSHRGWAGDL